MFLPRRQAEDTQPFPANWHTRICLRQFGWSGLKHMEDIQNLPGRGHVQSALGDPAVAEELD